MIADDYRRLVDIKQHIIIAGIQVAVTVFLKRQINGGIGSAMVVYYEPKELPEPLLKDHRYPF